MRTWIIYVVLAVVLMAGCVEEDPVGGDGCRFIKGADTKVCSVEIAGNDCDIVLPPNGPRETVCKDEAMECSSNGGRQDANNSGNICRVKLSNGAECVSVLPDGGKDPHDYKDFTVCPEAPRGARSKDQ